MKYTEAFLVVPEQPLAIAEVNLPVPLIGQSAESRAAMAVYDDLTENEHQVYPLFTGVTNLSEFMGYPNMVDMDFVPYALTDGFGSHFVLSHDRDMRRVPEGLIPQMKQGTDYDVLVLIQRHQDTQDYMATLAIAPDIQDPSVNPYSLTYRFGTI